MDKNKEDVKIYNFLKHIEDGINDLEKIKDQLVEEYNGISTERECSQSSRKSY